MSQDAIATVEDGRSALERAAWRYIGPPAYYCSACLVGVSVKASAHGEPAIERHCAHHDAQIIAPRRAILAGEGGLNKANQMRQFFAQAKTAITGRT